MGPVCRVIVFLEPLTCNSRFHASDTCKNLHICTNPPYLQTCGENELNDKVLCMRDSVLHNHGSDHNTQQKVHTTHTHTHTHTRESGARGTGRNNLNPPVYMLTA